MEELVFEKQTHRFYDDIISYIISTSAIGPTLELQKYSKATKWVCSEKLVIEPGKVFNNFQLFTYPSILLDDIAKIYGLIKLFSIKSKSIIPK